MLRPRNNTHAVEQQIGLRRASELHKRPTPDWETTEGCVKGLLESSTINAVSHNGVPQTPEFSISPNAYLISKGLDGTSYRSVDIPGFAINTLAFLRRNPSIAMRTLDYERSVTFPGRSCAQLTFGVSPTLPNTGAKTIARLLRNHDFTSCKVSVS